MSSPAPSAGPSTRRYVVAGVLAALALTVGTVVAVIIGRALVGYEITSFASDTPTTVTVGDRGVAIWISPEQASGSCMSIDDETGADSISRGTASEMTVSKGSRSWSRVGIVEGPEGSRHTVTCTDGGGAEAFGHAANPRIAHYVLIGVGGGAAAGLLAIAALILFLVTIIQRSKVRNRA